MNRRELLGAAAAAATFTSGAARAQERYPSRPVTVVSPFAPGGQSDGVGRIVTAHLQRALGQPFVIENRTGAGGTIGAQYVARANPDGHTLLFGTTGVFVIAPYVYRNAGYEVPGSLVPVAMTAEVPVVMAASKRSGFASVADVVAAARRRPGEITFGSGGVGSFPQLMGEQFGALAGIRLTHVPYRGGAPALNDLVAGQVDLLFDGLSTVGPNVEAGRVTALLTTGGGGRAFIPGVQTALGAGMPDLDLTSWNGVLAPARTPVPILDALNREINAALAAPEAREVMARLGVIPLGGGRDAMAERVEREAAIYRRIITTAEITAEG